MNKEINDKIEIIKSVVNFFTQPILRIDHEFKYIPIDIDKEFLLFESYFYDAFKFKVERQFAIDRFSSLISKLGYRNFITDLDNQDPDWEYDWSSLVEYTIEGEYYDNTYFANYRKDPVADEEFITDHIKEGFDEKTKAKVMELLALLKLKFNNFSERIGQEVLNDQIFKNENSIIEKSAQTPEIKVKNENGNDQKDLNIGNYEKEINAYKLIFKTNFDISIISNNLIDYCESSKEEIESAIEGKVLTNKIKFKKHQNRLADFFYRLLLNECLLDNKAHVTRWLCNYFEYNYSRQGKSEYRNVNYNSVYDIFKETKQVDRKNRILDLEWLPIKPKKKN